MVPVGSAGVDEAWWLKRLSEDKVKREAAARGIHPDGGGATGAGERLGEPVTEDDALINCDTIMSDTDVVFRRHPFETCGASLTAQDKHILMVQFRDPYVAWATSLFTGVSRVIPEGALRRVFKRQGAWPRRSIRPRFGGCQHPEWQVSACRRTSTGPVGKGSLASSFDPLENCKVVSQADLAFSP